MTKSEIVDNVSKIEALIKTDEKLKKAGLFKPCRVDTENLFEEWNQMKSKYGAIARIPLDDLGEFLDKWTAMIAYTRWAEAVADIEMQSSREIRDMIRKQIYTNVEGSREIRDAMVHVDELFVKWNNRFIQDNALYIATKALRESYEHRYASISREITRRMSDTQQKNRSSSVNVRGY